MFVVVFLVFYSLLAELTPITLVPPNKTGGVPLLTALKNRKSDREFSDKELENQTLSDLLWAAGGVNREGWK
jgi:hypothetical protein